MPWNGRSFAQRHNHSLSGAKATKAASIANAILRRSGDDGLAIATANKRAKLQKRGMISPRAAQRQLTKEENINGSSA